MFDSNYNSELTLKKWAKIFMYLSYGLIGISIFSALIVLFVNAEDLWGVSLGILIGGLISAFPVMFLAHITYGFGTIVGNTAKNAVKANNEKDNDENALPEL